MPYPESYFGASNPLIWVERQLDRFTHRPGWTFEATVDGGINRRWYATHSPLIRVDIYFKAEDARSPGKTVTIGASKIVPTPVVRKQDPELFAHWLLNYAIREVEWHETREWFRRDGVIFDDPHKEQQP